MFAALQLKAVTALVLQGMGKPVIYLVNNVKFNENDYSLKCTTRGPITIYNKFRKKMSSKNF